LFDKLSPRRLGERGQGARGGVQGRSSERRSNRAIRLVSLAFAAVTLFTPSASEALLRFHKHKVPPGLADILPRMNDSANRLKTLSADLEYTKVTVLVDDKSTETGQIYYEKGKTPSLAIVFKKPDPKTIVIRNNKADVYVPATNLIQEYDLKKHSELVESLLLLGFGTNAGELQKNYNLKLVNEEDVGEDTTVVLELTPKREDVAAQLTKVQLWISEESWLPVQQKFFEPGGDYLVTRYSSVKVNRKLPDSVFEIEAAGAKKQKM